MECVTIMVCIDASFKVVDEENRIIETPDGNSIFLRDEVSILEELYEFVFMQPYRASLKTQN